MSNWVALVAPRKSTQDYAGRCLPFAQSFFGAPIRHDYAFQAWEAAQHRHGPEVPLPDVPVLLWFSHWGAYYSYSKGIYEYVNAGHVAIHVPGDAIYTSPGAGYGSERWATIAQIESRFGARFVGWSEDINGLRVAQPGSGSTVPSNGGTAPNKGVRDMAFESIRHPDGSIIFADEYGVEGIDAYRSADIGAAEYLDAFYHAFPGTKQLTARQFDIARAIALRRRDTIEARIADRVVARMGGTSTDAIVKAVTDAIAKQGVKVDATALAADIAKAVNDDAAKRMKD